MAFHSTISGHKVKLGNSGAGLAPIHHSVTDNHATRAVAIATAITEAGKAYRVYAHHGNHNYQWSVGAFDAPRVSEDFPTASTVAGDDPVVDVRVHSTDTIEPLQPAQVATFADGQTREIVEFFGFLMYQRTGGAWRKFDPDTSTVAGDRFRNYGATTVEKA